MFVLQLMRFEEQPVERGPETEAQQGIAHHHHYHYTNTSDVSVNRQLRILN